MALTRDFKETIQARIERDPAFREELLKEGVECLLSGDVDTGMRSTSITSTIIDKVEPWRCRSHRTQEEL